jgi:hypothetical protein
MSRVVYFMACWHYTVAPVIMSHQMESPLLSDKIRAALTQEA